MSAESTVNNLADSARKAGRTLITASYQDRSNALRAIAQGLLLNSARIVAANTLDITRGKSEQMSAALIDRLLLTPERITAIAHAVDKVAALPNPLGRTLRENLLENGLHLRQVTVPFGVVGMVYEARPNVTVDAAAILIASGNAVLLRGSSTAAESNEVLVAVMREVLATTKISPDVIQLVPSHDRDTVRALLQARGKVDLVIPRGGASLIRTVVDGATVPTIETGAGVCHVYIDEFADLTKALPIVLNSKTHRPSVCNAAETVLLHQGIATEFLPTLLTSLHRSGVKLHCDRASLAIAKSLSIPAELVQDENWSTEFGDLEMNVGVVSNLVAASDHILKFGTNHTESIVTESDSAAAQFVALSDCAAVMINASTRFTDGEEMGFGAEIGISNQKLHARGPMGVEAMTTTTWIVTGTGQIRK